MPTPTRIYVVGPKNEPKPTTDDVRRLVRAPNAAQALRHVARDLSVTCASQEELVDLISAGIAVETAGDSADESPDPDPAGKAPGEL